MDRDRQLADARLLRRAAKLLCDLDPTLIEALMRVSDQLQNEACGFTEPAGPYDDRPSAKEKEEPPLPLAE